MLGIQYFITYNIKYLKLFVNIEYLEIKPDHLSRLWIFFIIHI